MSEINPVETIAEVIGGIDYDYEQRDQAKRIVSAIRTSPPLRRSLWLALTADNPLNRLSNLPSSHASETEPETGTESHPRNSEAAESESKVGTNGEAEPDARHNDCCLKAGDEIARMAADLLAKDATIDRLTRVTQIIMATADDNLAAKDDTIKRFDRERQGFKAAIAQRDATIERLSKERHAAVRRLQDVVVEYQKAGASWDAQRARLDATIETLTAQRDDLQSSILELAPNPTTNVPDHNDPEFGFDKTAALSEPDEETS